MPIKDLSDDVRIPRLGKFHLGYKDPAKKGAPVKTDYFVMPKEHSSYEQLVKAFGEKPKEFRILIPVEDEEQWASQFYKAYNLTRGLVCKGDGENAMRMIDTKTKSLPVKDTETVTMVDMPCLGKECPEYKTKKCGEVMNLRFMLPEIPGLGVWQIDTGSINSILNINSCAKVIKKTFGRLTLIPLILSLEPINVNNPTDGKKQTVYVLNLRTNVTLNQLADLAREQSKTFRLTSPDFDAEYEVQVERNIEDMWGENPNGEKKTKPQVIVEGEVIKPPYQSSEDANSYPEDTKPPVKTESEEKKPETKKPSEKKPERNPDSIKTQAQLYKACNEDFTVPDKDGNPQPMQPRDVLKALEVTSYSELSDTPANCYRGILQKKGL